VTVLRVHVANASLCYVLRTFPILLHVVVLESTDCKNKEKGVLRKI
jgi:hypothetical protein